MKKLRVLLSCLISVVLANCALAAWVPLTGDAVPVSSIPVTGLEVGDKLFSEFEVTAVTEGGVGANCRHGACAGRSERRDGRLWLEVHP